MSAAACASNRAVPTSRTSSAHSCAACAYARGSGSVTNLSACAWTISIACLPVVVPEPPSLVDNLHYLLPTVTGLLWDVPRTSSRTGRADLHGKAGPQGRGVTGVMGVHKKGAISRGCGQSCGRAPRRQAQRIRCPRSAGSGLCTYPKDCPSVCPQALGQFRTRGGPNGLCCHSHRGQDDCAPR